MTWVLGWPIADDYVFEFARKRNLVPGVKDDEDDRLYSATVSYIAWHTECRAYCCWVDGTSGLVFALTTYDGPRSKPPKRVDPSELPPRENTARLVKFLGVHHRPFWYLYDDGSQASLEANPWLHLDSDEEDSSDEWDSESDDTEVARSDNDEEEDESFSDGNDSRGEAEASDVHEDVEGDGSLSALPTAFGWCFLIIRSLACLLTICFNIDSQCSI